MSSDTANETADPALREYFLKAVLEPDGTDGALFRAEGISSDIPDHMEHCFEELKNGRRTDITDRWPFYVSWKRDLAWKNPFLDGVSYDPAGTRQPALANCLHY